MKNNYFLNLIIFVFIFFGCSKKDKVKVSFNSSVDSLSVYFTQANNFDLAKEKRKNYNHKAFEIVIGQKNDSLNRVNLFKVANRYYNINSWTEYRKTVQFVLHNSEIAKDTANIIKAYSYLGDYYNVQGVLDSAYLFYYKVEKMYKNQGDNVNLAKILMSKANLQFNSGDFLGSQKSSFDVLRLIKTEKLANEIFYAAYNTLGISYNELGDFDRALEYNNKALSVIDSQIIPEEYQSKATSYNNIGFLYLDAKKYKQAKFFFAKGLEQKKLITQKPVLYAMLLDNLGYVKFKLKEKNRLPDLFNQSLNLRKSLKLSTGIFISKVHLSEYYASMGDSSKALQYSKEALLMARSSNVPKDILVALKQLAIIDPKKADLYNKEYIHINEELQKEERKMGEKFSRIEYETDEIKGENSDLEVQNRNLLYAFSVFAIVGLFFYIIKAQKAKNRELLYKQQQQKANEDIYNLMISQQSTIETNRVKEKKRVAQELHDGVLGRMFGIRMNLDSLNRIQDETAIVQRNSYLTELKNIEQDIREISHDLNREKSELINNFVAIVDNLLEDQRKTFIPKLVSSIDSSIKWDEVINSVKINLYRIVQESLQNINKYASATSIKIELKKKENNIVLFISDDGIGFNTITKKKGIGVQNMISRAQECNGEFTISSNKVAGTTITVTIPIEQKQIPK